MLALSRKPSQLTVQTTQRMPAATAPTTDIMIVDTMNIGSGHGDVYFNQKVFESLEADITSRSKMID